MFNNGLQLKLSGTKAVFKINPLKRISFFFIFFILLVGIISSQRGTPRLWIPAAVALLSLLGGLYTEEWIFDKTTDTVSAFTGLVLLGKKTRFSLSSVEEIRFTPIDSPHRRQRAVLFLFLKNGTRYTIDSAYGRLPSENLSQRAQLIAEFCGIPITSP